MELPVFPLPGLVFFPNTLLPLHIFEPRYRALTAWCLEHDHLMAVGGLHEVMGAGRIVRHQKLPDGRYHIVLMGEQRVRLQSELEERDGYRVFHVETANDTGDGAAQMASIHALASTLALRSEQAAEFLQRALDNDEPAVVADRLSAVLPPEERQAQLERLDVSARMDRLIEALASMM